MKKSILAVSAILFLLVAAIGGTVAFRWYTDNRKANVRRSTVIYVHPGDSFDKVVKNIVDSASVANRKSLERTLEKKQTSKYMQPGRYELKPGQTSVFIARMLNNCWQSPVRLVLSGTMRNKAAIAKKIANQMMVDSATVYAALNDDALLANYGFNSKNVFSLIIPDTYEMYWTATVEELLQKQKDAYDAFWTADRIAKAEKQNLSREEVSILASIVNGETNHEPEMPSIAGVYLNRLRIGMKLQADPTVAYCLDYSVNRILNKHLEIDSPYNTYKYEGLPPGPISVPTKACLDAVLNPDRHGYLYFCASAAFDGTHKFAVTFPEHLRNAREFQSALNARAKK